MMGQKIFGIVGWKNSGKTTMTERLIASLTARGYRISSVKHAHHGFDIDRPGTDSWRHRAAGAGEVAIIADHRFAIMHENATSAITRLDEVIARLAPCDLVLVEGFKSDDHKKLEMRRSGSSNDLPLAKDDPNIVAIACDTPQAGELIPCFAIDNIEEIASFIEKQMELRA